MSDKKILDELVKIRELLEPKPSPPAPEKPKGFANEFMAFINKHGIVGVAIAFIIGGAVKDLISALVSDLLMPVITPFIPGGAWREAVLAVGPFVLSVGHFTGALLDFIIVALLVFCIMKALKRANTNKL